MRQRQQQHGQGLLELVFALGIIIAAVVTTLGLLIATSAASAASKTQMVATNIAREGIEVVRGVRDSNWLELDSGVGTTWNAGLFLDEGGGPPPTLDFTAIGQFSPSAGEWSLGFTADAIADCRAVVYLNPATGVYSQIEFPAGNCDSLPLEFVSFQATQFRRLVTISPICWPASGLPDATYPEQVMGALSNQNCDEAFGAAVGDYEEDPVGVQIRSRVEWQERGRTRSTELIEKIFNWKT